MRKGFGMKEKQRIDEIVAQLAPELKELAHFIHDNPELFAYV